MEQTNTQTLEPVQAVVWQKIEDLQRLLQSSDPQIAGHLKEIHKNLIQYEELTHLLTDEQIRKIIGAQKIVTGTMLVGKVKAASSASIMKQAKQIDLDDL